MKRQRKIKIFIIIIFACILLYLLAVILIEKMLDSQMKQRIVEKDTFSQEDEKVLYDFFGVKPINEMEIIYARFVSIRDTVVSVWCSLTGDIDDFLSTNPHYILIDDDNGITEYEMETLKQTENGKVYHWRDSGVYMEIYKQYDHYIARFYTRDDKDGVWDIGKQVFYR